MQASTSSQQLVKTKARFLEAKLEEQLQASDQLRTEEDAKDDVEKAVTDGDKAADKTQAQVDKQDSEFDPDNAAEDEVEAVPEDEADDAVELEDFILLCEGEEEMEDKEVAAAAQAEDKDADMVEEPEAAVDDNDLDENDLAEDEEEEDFEDESLLPRRLRVQQSPQSREQLQKRGLPHFGKNAAGKTAAVAKGGKNNKKGLVDFANK
ncbi:hypothetical protein WJX77_000141 [Trebouxia sp. C0004]